MRTNSHFVALKSGGVCLPLVPAKITSLCLCVVDAQGNNLTLSHVSSRQPVPGVPLMVTVDMLESSFVHEGRGTGAPGSSGSSPVSHEQLMMLLSRVDVLHIRASYFTSVTRIEYVPPLYHCSS